MASQPVGRLRRPRSHFRPLIARAIHPLLGLLRLARAGDLRLARAVERIAWGAEHLLLPVAALMSWSAVVGCKGRKAMSAVPLDAAPSEIAALTVDGGESEGGPATSMIAALNSPTPIYIRPELPPRDAVDERKAARLGSLRKGQTVAVKPEIIKGGRCKEGWYELVQGGFVCGRYATQDLSQKELQDAPHAPFADRSLPYDYGLNLTNGTPMYRRLPLRRERAEYEKGLQVGRTKKQTEERAAAVEEVVAEKGTTPWYLRDNARDGLSMDDLKGESQLVLLRMARGFYVALDQEVHAFAGRLWRTTRGAYVPREFILVHESKSDFEGVWVGRDDEPRKLPLGFSLHTNAHRYVFSQPDKAPSQSGDFPKFAVTALTGKHLAYGGQGYDETTSGWWMRTSDGAVVQAGGIPGDLGPGEKWIEVNLAAQSLVAFEGNKPMFATLISSGRHDDNDKAHDHRTPSGSFRIREKHITTTMDDDTATDGPYSIEDVPWVMYFEKGYALHGAFWHSSFGHERSHGCVNMTPHDARELFNWVGPTLPAGWHSVRATAENPGTRVIVHE